MINKTELKDVVLRFQSKTDISIKDIFGEESIIDTSQIDLMIELVDYKNDFNYERLGYDTTFINHAIIGGWS